MKRGKDIIDNMEAKEFYQRIFCGVMGTPAFTHLMSLGLSKTREDELRFICDEFTAAGVPVVYHPDHLDEIEAIAWHASRRAIILQFQA